jgi:hypothetical protein
LKAKDKEGIKSINTRLTPSAVIRKQIGSIWLDSISFMAYLKCAEEEASEKRKTLADDFTAFFETLKKLDL